MKNLFLLFSLALTLVFPHTAMAEIERTMDPFSNSVIYTSKATFSDDDRNMHSIALVRVIKPLRSSGAVKRFDFDTHFLLNFALQGSTTLGETFDIRINDNLYTQLPLAPVLNSNISMSAISTTARTGPKELLELVTGVIEKGQELLVRVNFSRGSSMITIPAEQTAEWAKILKITTDDAFPDDTK